MRNVGIVINDITRSAGTERAVTNLSNMLVENSEYSVYIFSVYSKDTQKCYFDLDEKVKVIHLGFECKSGKSRIPNYIRLIGILNKKRKEYNLTFILGTANEYNSLLPLIRRCKKIGCEHFNYEAGSKRSKFVRKCAYPFLDAVVLLTEADYRKYPFLDENKKYVIPNSLSFECKHPADLSNKRMISVGRLSKQKGYDILIDMAVQLQRELPNWHIDIFGDGVDKNKLEDLIKENRLEGFVNICKPVSTIKEEMLNSSLYLLTSRFEGFGLVLIEAQACGLPSIAFDCPEGPAEIVNDGYNGSLVPLYNTDTFVKKVIELANDYQLRMEYGEHAFESSKRYNKSNIYRKWNNLFNELSKK